MAKRPIPAGLARAHGRSPPQRFGYEKLPGASKRWRNLESGETISDRKMADMSREARLGEKTTKEQYQRAVTSGRYQRVDEERQTRASAGKAIRKQIPDIAPADARVAVKFNTQGGYAALDDDEKERFEMLFKRYPKDSVREALGSPKRRKHDRRRVSNERTIRRNAPRNFRPVRQRKRG
jgi:hypothetical protein